MCGSVVNVRGKVVAVQDARFSDRPGYQLDDDGGGWVPWIVAAEGEKSPVVGQALDVSVRIVCSDGGDPDTKIIGSSKEVHRTVLK